MKQKTYYISGMHCASCELIIENRILKEAGVSVVDASLGNGTATISYENHAPSTKELNAWFREDGYVFSETKIEENKSRIMSDPQSCGVRVNTSVLKKRMKTTAIILLIFLALFLIERSGVARYVSVSEQSSLGIFFLFGILAGLSSCAALIGGILLSMTKQWNETLGYDASVKTKMIPQWYFHGGRLFSHALFGGILGAAGKAISFDNTAVYVGMVLIVSFVMLIIGLQMAGVGWAERCQIRLPKFVGRAIASGGHASTKQMPFWIGAGTVLLPCGFTLVAEGIALTSGSALRGSLLLVFFVLGTMIPLLGIGMASITGTKNPKRARAFSFYTGIVLVVFALYNMNGQLNVLGLPSIHDLFATSDNKAEAVGLEDTVSEKQTVTIVAKGFSYQRTDNSTIRSGIPTMLVVDNQGIQGCGAFIAARGLIKGFVPLQNGNNIIDLGTPKRGIYKITCSMGMVPPVTLHVL